MDEVDVYTDLSTFALVRDVPNLTKVPFRVGDERFAHSSSHRILITRAGCTVHSGVTVLPASRTDRLRVAADFPQYDIMSVTSGLGQSLTSLSMLY